MSRLRQLVSTPARLTIFVALIYLLSAFFSASIREIDPQPGDHPVWYRKNYWVVASMPRILRGDEMHYLLMAHSLAHDGDLYLSREYTHVQQGGPEMGVYHAHRAADNFFQHFSRDRNFTLLANHPFGFSALLAMLLWPLAGSTWMEPAAIWITCLWGAMGVLVFLRVLELLGVCWRHARNAALLLAFATPWFSYSRTLYTEVYIGTAMLIVMLAVLKNRSLWALPFVIAMAWFKYPALTLFFGAGTGEALQKRWRNFYIYGVVGAVSLVCVYSFNRWFFHNASWVTRDQAAPASRLQSVATAAAPIAWVPGEIFSNIKRLFTDFDKGLLPHCPLLFVAVAGLAIMAKQARRTLWLILIIAGPWALTHITYRYLMAGASYTTRYLVPIVPMACIGLPWYWQWIKDKSRWWRWAAWLLIGISLINNTIAGLLPALTFDHKPWEIWADFGRVIWTLLGTGSHF